MDIVQSGREGSGPGVHDTDTGMGNNARYCPVLPGIGFASPVLGPGVARYRP